MCTDLFKLLHQGDSNESQIEVLNEQQYSQTWLKGSSKTQELAA